MSPTTEISAETSRNILWESIMGIGEALLQF